MNDRQVEPGAYCLRKGGQTTVCANRSFEKNVTTGQETLYYWLGGRLVAVKKAGTLSYVHPDHLGSTSVVTDTAGATASTLTYIPYGSSRTSPRGRAFPWRKNKK